VIDHILYSRNDNEAFEKLKPSLEEATPVQSKEQALDFIGRRGTGVGLERGKR
jgi:DNA-directed RNA polymerase II subunit RPB2